MLCAALIYISALTIPLYIRLLACSYRVVCCARSCFIYIFVRLFAYTAECTALRMYGCSALVKQMTRNTQASRLAGIQARHIEDRVVVGIHFIRPAYQLLCVRVRSSTG